MTGAPPSALLSRPDLEPHLQIYWDSYRRLSRSRAWTDGLPQNVTVQECFAYCDGMRWRSPSFKQDLLDLVQEMDEVFLSHQVKKREEAQKVKGAGSDVAV